MFKLKKWLALLAIGIMGGIASFAGTAKAESYNGNARDFKVYKVSNANANGDATTVLNSLQGNYGHMIRFKTFYSFSVDSSQIYPGSKLKLGTVSVRTNSMTFDSACINGVLGQAGGGLLTSDIYTREGQKIGTVKRANSPQNSDTQEYYVEFSTDKPDKMIGLQTFKLEPAGARAFNYQTSPRIFAGYSKIDGNVYYKDTDGKTSADIQIHLTAPPTRHGNLKYVGGQPEIKGNGVNQSRYNSGYANFTDAFYRCTHNHWGEDTSLFRANVNKQSNIQLCQDMTVITNKDVNLTTFLNYHVCGDKQTGNRNLNKVGDTASSGYRIRIPIVDKGSDGKTYFIDDGKDLQFNFPWITWYNIDGKNATDLPITRVANGLSASQMRDILNKNPQKTQGLLSVQGKTRYIMVYNITPSWLQKQVSNILDNADSDGGIIDNSFYYTSKSASERKNIISYTRSFLKDKLNGYMRFDIWGVGTDYKYPQLAKHVTERDYTLNVGSPFEMKNGNYVEEADSPLDLHLQDGQGGLAIHTMDAESGAESNPELRTPSISAGWENTDFKVNVNDYKPDGDYTLVTVRGGKKPIGLEGSDSLALSKSLTVKYPKRNTWKNLFIYYARRKAPTKTASVSQVSFDGKEFTYDVKQQVNKFNTDIFDKYSQMSFDDKVPDSLQVTDVQILKDGTDVTGQVGSVYGRNGRGFYNNERNHVHCDFSSGYLDKMSLDGETYTMRIHVKYTAHKLQSQETEIKNSAEVRINNDGRTASATVKVPKTPDWYHGDKFKKTSNKSTFDGTKDEIIRYTLKAQYSNEWHPWGSLFKDNMPDNATLDTNSIKVTYYDPMTGEHQNLNVNDYFTNKSDSKHLELVLNKDKDGKSGSTDKFINSQVTVTYDMTIHGNSYWSGGYSDKPGTKYYNAGTGKITVPNIATWKENQDDNAPVLTSEADVTTDARPSSLQKSAAQSTFDYSKEQTLSYTLTAKFGNLTYPKGAVLRDVIPENCTLDTNSIRMKLTDPSGKMSDIKTSDYFTDKSDSKRIELLMNKNMQESSMRMFVNSKLTVTYNMKISGNADWSDYYNSTAHRIDVPNTATFTDSDSPDKTTHSSTATVTTQCQEPSITAYIAQDNGSFMQGTKKVHYSRNSTDSSEKAVTTAYKVVVGNYRKVSALSVLATSPEDFDISRVVTRNSISNNAEAKSQDYTGTGLALSASGNSARAEKTNAQSLVGKSFTMIVKTAPTVRNWQKYAKLAGNTGSYRAGLSLTYRSSGGADGKNIYANTVSATVPNVYEYKPLASVKTADGKLKYYGKLSGLAVSASSPTTFTSNAVTLNGSSVALPGGIKTSQSQNIVTSLNAANKAEVKANNDLENADRAVIVTDSKLNAGESDTGIKTDFTPMNSGKITKANTLYLNSYGQINYYDYDNGKISRKVLNEAYVFSAKFDEPQAKGGYGIYNPNSFKAVCYNDFVDIADKFATVFTDRDGLTDAGYIAKHGNVYTEKLDFTSKTGNADISNIDTVLGKTTLNAADRNRNLKQTVLGTTGADEADHALKHARENELHLTPQAHYLNLNYRFNHRGLTNGKQFLVKADNKYPAYNTSQTFDSGYDGGHRLYLRDWLKDGSYRTNYSCNGFGSLNRMSLNVDQSIRIYGRRYLSKEHGFNKGGEISVQPAMSDKDYNIKGGSQSLQNWLGNY